MSLANQQNQWLQGMGQPTWNPVEDEEEKLRAAVQAKYPGRSWAELTEEEKQSVLRDFKGAGSEYGTIAQQGMEMLTAGPTRVGNVAVANPWNALAGGVMAGYGFRKMRENRKEQEAARRTAADLRTREYAIRDEEEEEERDRINRLYEAMMSRF